MSSQSAISAPVSAPADPFAAGHLGELTQIVSVDLVGAAIDAAGAAQKRVRRLPTRVVVYLLLAAVLFADVGYRQVMGRLVAGAGSATGVPGSSALSQALRRIGIAPLRELFDLLRGPAAGSPRWRGLLVCAIDGTTMSVPDTAANAAAFGRQTGRPDTPAGYPMLRLVVRATAAWAGCPVGLSDPDRSVHVRATASGLSTVHDGAEEGSWPWMQVGEGRAACRLP